MLMLSFISEEPRRPSSAFNHPVAPVLPCRDADKVSDSVRGGVVLKDSAPRDCKLALTVWFVNDRLAARSRQALAIQP